MSRKARNIRRATERTKGRGGDRKPKRRTETKRKEETLTLPIAFDYSKKCNAINI